MQITDARVKKVITKGKMRAVATITFDNEFVVHDIRVIERVNKETGENELFIAMPSKDTPKGEHKDIAHPINQETRDKIQKVILEAYEKAEEPTPRTEE